MTDSHDEHAEECPIPNATVKLIRNSRRSAFEVSYEHPDLDVALAKIREAHDRLQAEYGGQA